MNTDEVLVRPPRKEGFVSSLVLGVLLLVLAVFLVLVPKPPMREVGLATAVGALFFMVLGTVWGTTEYRKRCWVSLTPTGFIHRGPKGERKFTDTQFISITLRFDRHFNSGLLTGRTRHLALWIATEDDQPEKLTLTTYIKTEADDPLQPLIERVVARLLDRARQEWQQGLSVLGEGWLLEKQQLSMNPRKGQPIDINVPQLTAVDVVDDHVCIWIEGRDEVAAKLPVKTANAHILLLLLQEHLAKSERKDEEPQDGRLGRILFERRGSRFSSIGLWIIGGLLGLVAFLLLIAALAEPVILLFALGVGVLAIASFIGAFFMKKSVFRCHEWGVYQSGLFGTKTLRYDDVQSFTYGATRHFHNGVYTGTHLVLSLVPKPDSASHAITYRATLQNMDLELDNLRDHIAQVIARHMLRQLQRGKSVVWTPSISFLPQALEFQPPGWFGRKEAVVLPYSDIQGVNIEQGVFYLFAKGSSKHVTQENISAANFFPGYVLLCTILNAPILEPEQDAEAEEPVDAIPVEE